MAIIKQTGVDESHGKCRIRFRGKEFQIDAVTQYPYPSGIAEAAVELEKRKRAAAKAIAAGITVTQAPTLQKWCQHWLNTAPLRDGSRAKAKGHINNVWLAELGNPNIDQITRTDIKRVIATTAHLAYATRRNIKATISSCLQAAVDEGVLELNPCFGVKVPNTRKGKKRPPPDPFTLDERDKLLAAMAAVDSARHTYWAIRFLAGLRPGETLALTWADYQRADGQLIVNKEIQRGKLYHYTKTTDEGDGGRSVYVIEDLRKILNAHPRDLRTDHIIATKYGKPFTTSEEHRRPFNKAMKDLGIRYRSPYNARHTRATDLLERGVDRSIAADELGHSIQTFENIYAKWLNKDRKKRAFALMEADL